MSLFYTKKFYLRDYERTSKSAQVVIPILIDAFGGELSSVIDIGCGRGVWLEEFAKRGVGAIKGRDGAWVKDANPLIRADEFEATDLSKPYSEAARYDLAMTLEVAEHIDEVSADVFVDGLTSLSDNIMFSAAIEGQGGQYHVNERPLGYWIEKFAQRGYKAYDPVRPHVWGDDRVC
ncbi:Methyltransferase domain containing protein [uncultured Caudovirales phage]|uniref:Methyltransferase domain containing protein n=1 Tax=uncultured Caudovirales phage TaxID=2100421 RepID=A0A6J7W9G5_9CAUD|nr:Methyltransferase domain containing protein [uncultured Caudovirales phage]